MTTDIGKVTAVTRLQHFIDFATDGEDVQLQIETSKKSFDKEYLLAAKYTRVDSKDMSQFVSKIYGQGLLDESVSDTKINNYVVNQRLGIDYDRLTKAGIHFKEKFF